MKNPVLAPLALALGLVLSATALADQVRLRTGTTYEGKIVSADESEVVIETADLGSLAIRLGEVETIERDGRTLVVTPDGRIVEQGQEPPATEEPDPAPESGDETPPAPAAEESEPAGEPGDEPSEAETAEETAAPEPELPRSALELLQRQRERLEQRSRGRLRRRTVTSAATTAPAASDTTTRATEIAGAELARVDAGRPVIVFRPLRRFRDDLSGIELGERTFAKMKAAGVTSAWLQIPFEAGDERYSVRLDEVKRHVMAQLPSARSRMLEGIRTGDWLRLRLDDGSTVQGALAGYEGGSLKLERVDAQGESDKTSVSILDVVQLDGLQRNTGAVQALGELEEDEPVAITYWPGGDEVLGRVTKTEPRGAWIDSDGDGARDHFVATTAPLAEVTRVPPHWRNAVRELRAGSLVKLTRFDDYDDVRVEQTFRTRVAALTAHAVSVETDAGAAVVPFAQLQQLDELDREEANEVIQGLLEKDDSRHHSDVPVLPGAEAAAADGLDRSQGLSALTDGKHVTHVFATPPFRGEIYGFTLGTSTRKALRDTDLRFHTIVRPVGDERATRPVEYVSDTLRGMRVTLLVSPAGVIEAVELSRR